MISDEGALVMAKAIAASSAVSMDVVGIVAEAVMALAELIAAMAWAGYVRYGAASV